MVFLYQLIYKIITCRNKMEGNKWPLLYFIHILNIIFCITVFDPMLNLSSPVLVAFPILPQLAAITRVTGAWLLKGLIIDRCVLLTSTPECVVSPRRAITKVQPVAMQHTKELISTTHTYPWLIPIITWCRPFPFVPTNIQLIKSKLKLESRAIAVGVAMSPRKLGLFV